MATLAQSAFASEGNGAYAGGGGELPLSAGAINVQASGFELPANAPIPGKVKVWRVDKGFGFLTADIGGPDVFVHKNQLSDGQALNTGASVVFQCRYNAGRGKYEATTCSGAIGGSLEGDEAAFAAPGAAHFGGGHVSDNCFVAGLPIDFTQEQVNSFFSTYGVVKQCKVLPDQPGKPDKAALVRFADELQAKWMVENLNGTIPPGLSGPITVRFAGDRGAGAAALAQAGGCGGGYGKMGGGFPTIDNRFTPYGGGASGPALYGMAPATGTIPMAAPTPSLGGAMDIAGALSTLLPALQQNPQLVGTLQSLQGLAGLASTASALSGPTVTPGIMGLGSLVSQPGPPPPPPAAADGGSWQEAQDPGTGKTYYYHSVTRETRWDKPT
mmetsp:Transcript_78666/g.170006  ORF Transcript_78666/g.170006 Transcript_78666/m.170006 type:complete len:385 (+) Transcript_78666:104-1258(+)